MAAKKKRTKKTSKPAKAKKAPARKAKKTAKKAAKHPAKKAGASAGSVATAYGRATPKKATARKSVKAVAKKAPAKKTKKASKSRKTIGEGDYAASRRFDRDEASFVKRNKAVIPGMGKEAEKALDGPEGAELREAEATAAARSRDIF